MKNQIQAAKKPTSASSLSTYSSFDLPTELEIVSVFLSVLGHVQQPQRVHVNLADKACSVRTCFASTKTCLPITRIASKTRIRSCFHDINFVSAGRIFLRTCYYCERLLQLYNLLARLDDNAVIQTSHQVNCRTHNFHHRTTNAEKCS